MVIKIYTLFLHKLYMRIIECKGCYILNEINLQMMRLEKRWSLFQNNHFKQKQKAFLMNKQ